MTLGQAIRKARIDRDMQQQDLATLTKISQKYLSQIEHDHVDPGYSKVRKIALALKVSLDALTLEGRPGSGC